MMTLFLSFLIFTTTQVFAKDLLTEIQFDLCPPALAAAVKAFELKQSDGLRRNVYLFDNARNALASKGLILRLRVRPDAAKFTVKIRGLDPEAIPGKYWRDEDFKCEYDQHGKQKILACSFSAKISNSDASRVVKNEKQWDWLLSRSQSEFLEQFSPVNNLEGVKLATVLQQLTWSFARDEFSDDMALEFTKGSDFERLEYSVRTDDPKALEPELIQDLKRRGLKVCGPSKARRQ